MHSVQGNFPLASSRYMRADIYAGQMWLLIILLARHLHAYGELSINYCERRLKVFFFTDNHLAFLSHDQILHAFNYSDISLVASLARGRNRYPNLKDVQNKESDPQKLIRGRSCFRMFDQIFVSPNCPSSFLCTVFHASSEEKYVK